MIFIHYYCHSPELLNSIETLLGYKSMNIITLFVTTSLIALIVVAGGSMIITPSINAQENSTSVSQSQNATSSATTNTTGVAEESTYILIFGHRIVGNIDNSTKIVSSIVGNNSTKIQEELLEEISLMPTQQLEEQVNRVVNDGISGLPCVGVSLVTEQGENLSVECISSGNAVIWHIYPTP
jgi:hypothetical protein